MSNSKVVLVVGGARKGGMGRAIAERFLADGASVVLSDIGRPLDTHPDYEVVGSTALDQSVADLSAMGEVSGVACDVTKEHEVIAMFDRVIEAYDRVDVVVNCAGLAIGLTPVVDLTLQDWQINLDVMSTGAFLVAREAAKRMIPRESGRIITIASQAGKTGQPFLAAYSAAKFSVIGLTQSLAGELGKHGITVNAVCPGTIDTPLLAVEGGVYEVFSKAAKKDPAEYRERLIRTIPMKRFGTPEDVASAVMFLASEQASFVTGEALNVTGGQEMH